MDKSLDLIACKYLLLILFLDFFRCLRGLTTPELDMGLMFSLSIILMGFDLMGVTRRDQMTNVLKNAFLDFEQAVFFDL